MEIESFLHERRIGKHGHWQDASLEHSRKTFKVAVNHFEKIADQHDVSSTFEVAAKTPNKELAGRKVHTMGDPGGWFPSFVQRFRLLKSKMEEFTILQPGNPDDRARKLRK